jgi:hypothetical protein
MEKNGNRRHCTFSRSTHSPLEVQLHKESTQCAGFSPSNPPNPGVSASGKSPRAPRSWWVLQPCQTHSVIVTSSSLGEPTSVPEPALHTYPHPTHTALGTQPDLVHRCAWAGGSY